MSEKLQNMSMTRRRSTLTQIAALIQVVYNRLKEKSKKNRLVEELSTNKKRYSKQKVLKFLNNNTDIADNIIEQTSGQTREQAASTILSNINEYNNIFFIPFHSGIPTSEPATRAERRASVPAPATSISQQFENVDESIQATSFLPPRNPEQRQIASSQKDSLLSTASDEELITQLNITLDRLVELENIKHPSPEQEQQRQQVLGVTERLIKRFPRITGRTLSGDLLQMPAARQRFDLFNRNVSTPLEASSSGKPLRNESNLRGEEREQPKPNASGDPIQDVQHEAENAGSDEVQRSENINQGSGQILNFDAISRSINSITTVSGTERAIIKMTPQPLKKLMRDLIKGKLTKSPDTVIRGSIVAVSLMGGASAPVANFLNQIIKSIQDNGVSLDKYIVKSDEGRYTITVDGFNLDPQIKKSYLTINKNRLQQIKNTLQRLGLSQDILNDFNIDELSIRDAEIVEEELIQGVIPDRFIEELEEIIQETNSGASLNDEEVSNILEVRKSKIEDIKEQEPTAIERKEQPPAISPGAVVAGGLAGAAAVGATIGGGVSVPAAVAGGAVAGAAGAAAARMAGITGPAQTLAGAGAAVLGGVAGGLLSREPVKLPPDTLKVVQQDEKGTGKLRPKFIIPSTDILQPTNQQVQADMDEWNMFDFVNPTSEGTQGTAASNPLKLQALQENEIRYRDAGVDVTPMFWDDLPYSNEQLIEHMLGPALPPLPEMKFQENEEEFFDDRGMPQLSLWGRHGGYNASSQAHAIEIESPFRNFTEVSQLDEDINNSILYGSIPMPFPPSGKF